MPATPWWRPAQVAALIVWFSTFAGFYAFFMPVLPTIQWQVATSATYTVAAVVVLCSYFCVSCADTADNTRDGPLYCSHCEKYVQRGTRHCRVCQKCVLGFDHHCKWVHNCIGRSNYKAFLILLSSTCSMLLVQLASGLDDLVECIRAPEDMDRRIQAAYPIAISRQGYMAALCCYLAVVAAAVYGLGDLCLFHLVLVIRGMTTYDYIMAHHDAALAAAALSPRGSTSLSLKGLVPMAMRSSKVHDSSILHSSNMITSSTNSAAAVHIGGAPRRVLSLPIKQRASLTPCSACLISQSAVVARQHAATYQRSPSQASQPPSLRTTQHFRTRAASCANEAYDAAGAGAGHLGASDAQLSTWRQQRTASFEGVQTQDPQQ